MRHRSTIPTAITAVLVFALTDSSGALAVSHASVCAGARPGSDMAADCIVEDFLDLAARGTTERFEPIGYKCAAHDGEPTELIEGNDRITSRTRATFSTGRIVSLDVDLIYPTHDDVSIVKGDPARLTDPEDVVIARKQMALLSMLKDQICPAGETVTLKLSAQLGRNRAAIVSP